MTSKLTREWLQHQISAIEVVGITDSNTLLAFKLALTAMDSEPVAEVLSNRPGNDTSTIDRALPVGTQLYRHAQQPVVQMIHEESRCDNSPANDTNVVKRLTITLPDTSSKAFWSGAGKTETFHPVTYRRWVKEAIERCCAIARIDVEVK